MYEVFKFWWFSLATNLWTALAIHLTFITAMVTVVVIGFRREKLSAWGPGAGRTARTVLSAAAGLIVTLGTIGSGLGFYTGCARLLHIGGQPPDFIDFVFPLCEALPQFIVSLIFAAVCLGVILITAIVDARPAQ